MVEKTIRKGSSFFMEDVPAKEVFTPEDFSEEHLMIIKTLEDFVKNEIVPNIDAIEHKDWDLTRKLMLQAGELGFLGVDIEEDYGGTDMDHISSLLVIEHSSRSGSFGLTLSCHTGIGSMPLVFFGNKEQKEKYLPGLASGETIGAYALTEPGAGTDALSIQTTAVLSPDGKYYKLNGAKQYITNSGFADIIFTYAKVDGDKMTAFILERGFEGISIGAEEKKMGLRGSSTCSIFLDGAKVPVENVLFEIGRGHIVAFNILNLGRFKLGAGSVGVAKLALESSVGYSKERQQFGKPICQFGMIKHKIAEMATRLYMAESMAYRTGGLIDTIFATVDRKADDAGRQNANSIFEYVVECSINKVYCSEMLAYVSDEAVQIYGGYGYCEEYPVERIYRDNRIFRIFEGTNEINRLLIIGQMVRKALKNEIPLLPEAEKVKGEIATMEPLSLRTDDGPLGYQHRIVGRAKKIFLFLCGSAAQKYGLALEEEQEIISLLSDISQEVYAMESGLLRALKSIDSVGEQQSKLKIDMVQLYVSDAMVRVASYAQKIIAAMETGETLDSQLAALRKIAQFTPVNGVQLRRGIADRIIEVGKYIS
ncbi:MAG: acyl-CoA dehydrogenase family protein [Dehalococcoidia bacterium]|nr:acyl-CoA dehydrogenase family protein [Dehalococcoidia bacterium]